MQSGDSTSRSFRIVRARAAVRPVSRFRSASVNETSSALAASQAGCDRMKSRSRAPVARKEPMLRVGYPATLPAELFRDFPEGIELIPVSDKMDHDVEIDVWIPDPYSTQGDPRMAAPARREAGAGDDGGDGVDSRDGGPARDHLQCAWRAQYLHRRVDGGGNPGDAEVLSAVSRHSAVGRVEAAFRGQRALRGDHRRHARSLSAGDARRADRQDGAAGGVRRDRQGDRAHARAVST